MSDAQVVFGPRCALLLAPGGSVWGWGQNREILGPDRTGNDSRHFQPVAIGGDWIRIAATDHGGVGLRSDGSLQRWHFDRSGRLTLMQLPAPDSVVTGPQAEPVVWRDLVAGALHLLALRSDGTAWALGANQRGQLGDGTFYARTTWTQVRSDRRWKSIAAGDLNSFGIDTEGSLWHWGFIENPGEPGSGFDSRLPNRISGGPWIAVQPGRAYSCARTSDHRWWVWGPASENFLGSTNRHLPFALPPRAETRIAVVCSTSLVLLDTTGRLWTLGGSPGIAATPAPAPPAWRPLFPPKRWTHLWAGADTAFAIDTGGTLWTWGLDLSAPSPVDRALSATSEWLREHGIPARFGQADNRWNLQPLALARFGKAP